MNIFDRFSEHWYEIGLNLLVADSTLKWILRQAMSSSMKMKLVLQEWGKLRDKSSITWQEIILMISREPINKPLLRHEIELLAEKCK